MKYKFVLKRITQKVEEREFLYRGQKIIVHSEQHFLSDQDLPEHFQPYLFLDGVLIKTKYHRTIIYDKTVVSSETFNQGCNEPYTSEITRSRKIMFIVEEL